MQILLNEGQDAATGIQVDRFGQKLEFRKDFFILRALFAGFWVFIDHFFCWQSSA